MQLEWIEIVFSGRCGSGFILESRIVSGGEMGVFVLAPPGTVGDWGIDNGLAGRSTRTGASAVTFAELAASLTAFLLYCLVHPTEIMET